MGDETLQKSTRVLSYALSHATGNIRSTLSPLLKEDPRSVSIIQNISHIPAPLRSSRYAEKG